MPEVAVNGLMLDYPHSGTAVYIRNLAKHLPQAAPDFRFRLLLRQASNGFGIESRRLSTPFKHFNRGYGVGARVDKLVWEIATLPIAAGFTRQDLIHFPYFAAPPLASVPLVVTVHDLIPLLLPAYHRSYQSQLYSRFMAWTVGRAPAIVTVSQHSKKDIVRLLGVPESQVYVTYEAVDDRFLSSDDSENPARVSDDAIRDKYHLPDRFFLYLGSSERRKNLELLVQSWKRVADHMRKREVRLVIVARFPPPDSLYPDIQGLTKELELEHDIVFVPEVDEDDKPEVYRAALAFCFPSTYEGFGFTPLEAMASGIPVISSNASSLPEVVGDGGLLLDPNNADDWSEALVLLADHDSQRRRWGDRGRAQAHRFSWKRTASETAEVYRQVLSA